MRSIAQIGCGTCRVELDSATARNVAARRGAWEFELYIFVVVADCVRAPYVEVGVERETGERTAGPLPDFG